MTGRNAEDFEKWVDSHSGEPRRISHIGIGLNPKLTTPLGWTLPDHCAAGSVWLALGENRHMKGENTSSLLDDYAIPDASLLAGQRLVVSRGVLVGHSES